METRGTDTAIDRNPENDDSSTGGPKDRRQHRRRESDQAVSSGETPEDVAILYSWANIQGARYRDFSASRREYRAQMRRRAAELLREQERTLAAASEASGFEAEPITAFSSSGLLTLNLNSNPARLQPSTTSLEAETKSASIADKHADEHIAASTWIDASATPLAIEEEPATPEAHELFGTESSDVNAEIASADIPQASGDVAELHPTIEAPVEIAHEYRDTAELVDIPHAGAEDLSGYDPLLYDADLWQPASIEAHAEEAQPLMANSSAPAESMEEIQHHAHAVDLHAIEEPMADPSTQITNAELGVSDMTHDHETSSVVEREHVSQTPLTDALESRPSTSLYLEAAASASHADDRVVDRLPIYSSWSRSPQSTTPPSPPSPLNQPASLFSTSADGPAWLYAPQEPARPRVQPTPVPSPRASDTLQDSKERVAGRWYALRGVFDQEENAETRVREERQENVDDVRPPVLAVFSLAGGVGKTSLVATLGRSLSSLGERVLLADTTTHGLLPFYFGASELHPGIVRTFMPPQGCKDMPIHLVNYDVDRRSELQTREERRSEDSVSHDKLLDDLTQDSRGTHRVLLDLAATSSWVVRRVARANPTILLPIAADMNSVITLKSVTRFFESILDSEGQPLRPYFILNQFDSTLPLHLDVREVLVQQLGDRLLPFVLHRDPAISEALAEGMTIVDYEPDAVVTRDFLNLADWIRDLSAPVNADFRTLRWSEH